MPMATRFSLPCPRWTSIPAHSCSRRPASPQPRSANWGAARRSSTSIPAIPTPASPSTTSLSLRRTIGACAPTSPSATACATNGRPTSPIKFNIDSGNPYSSISQYDVAVFAQDDWRLRPNLTFSYGLRYEWQTNITDHGDFAPRLGFAWAPGKAKNGRQKTVIRGGFGMFYDRVNESLLERALLLNGVNQLSYTVTNPDTFPIAPAPASLTLAQNSIYRLDPKLRSDYMMQSAIGVERQLPRNTTVAVTYTNTRALHTSQTVPINTPLPGTYIPGLAGSGLRPYGLAAGNLFEYESGGHMQQNILMANFNTRFSKNVSLFGNYQFNHSNDLPGTPTDPYNFAQDWGRSSMERRHRFQLVGSVVAPLNIRLSPFITIQSGAPYDVLLGRDIYGNTLTNARPTFATATCTDRKSVE